MPFKSEAQRRYMWVHHPKIARKWAHKYGSKPQGKKKKKKKGKRSLPARMRNR